MTTTTLSNLGEAFSRARQSLVFLLGRWKGSSTQSPTSLVPSKNAKNVYDLIFLKKDRLKQRENNAWKVKVSSYITTISFLKKGILSAFNKSLPSGPKIAIIS